MTDPIHADHELSRRLERAEALSNASFVEAHARLDPAAGVEWIEVAGAYAMFDGANSPCTQTFGLGMFQLPTEAELSAVEKFFRMHGAPIYHEVSPLADKGLLPMLNDRGYRPFEMSTVMFLPLAERVPRPEPANGVRVRRVNDTSEDRELFVRTFAVGWSEYVEYADFMLEMARIAAATAGNTPFIAELDGCAVACGNLSIRGEVALFAGASTVPAFRRRGAQQALLEARFQYAQEVGCNLALMCADPGSGSQRNAERQGFRIAYTRTKWTLPSPPAVKPLSSVSET
jgi:GNAT superfamily N-acetyltransferase